MKLMSTFILLIASVFSLPAGADTAMALSTPGALVVRILPATEVRIAQTSARQEGGNVVVEGHIQRKKVHGRLIAKGHIDIAIIDQGGKTIQQTFTSYVPEILPRMDGRKSSFMARIPVLAPQGSVVSVTFHSGPHDHHLHPWSRPG